MGRVGEETVVRVGEKAAELIHPQLQFRALIDVARIVDAHLAGGGGQVGRHVVFHAVGMDHRVAPAQLGMAFEIGLDVGLQGELVAHDEGGQLAAGSLRNGLLQYGAGAQHGAGGHGGC